MLGKWCLTRMKVNQLGGKCVEAFFSVVISLCVSLASPNVLKVGVDLDDVLEQQPGRTFCFSGLKHSLQMQGNAV